MKVISLQSGSNGNCIYVEADGTALLFDAGISGRQAELRLAAHGRDIRGVAAVVISHDHADHVRCMGIYQRKFHLPVYVTPRTLDAAAAFCPLGRLGDTRPFVAGQVLAFDGVRVETIPTPHDAADGVAFVVDDGRRRVGILTDLGHAFDALGRAIGSLDAVVLESNYDPDLLAGGPYPEFLQRRIRGPGGHLSNFESAELLRLAAGPRLQWACLAHLSEQNNNPHLALRTHRAILGRGLPLHVASRYRVGAVLEV
jgi:phosphoribosyl 1,2-cyclic phosphodiesterase